MSDNVTFESPQQRPALKSEVHLTSPLQLGSHLEYVTPLALAVRGGESPFHVERERWRSALHRAGPTAAGRTVIGRTDIEVNGSYLSAKCVRTRVFQQHTMRWTLDSRVSEDYDHDHYW